MTYADFQRRFRRWREDITRQVLAENRRSIRVKKEERVLRNLERIFAAALKLSHRKGFQAMSMRELGREAGLSPGALYSYFSGKEELLAMLQHQGRTVTGRVLAEAVAAERTATHRLAAAVRTHLYLSEAMLPWFYFSYMEAKNLSRAELEKAVASERHTEEIFSEILAEGQRTGEFTARDRLLTAGLIKAMLQDWYLKRRKHEERRVSVERYAGVVLDFILAYVSKNPSPAARGGRWEEEEVPHGRG
jgi:AcrR family transcriptional regulator